MTKDQVKTLENRLSKSRIEIQSLRENLALIKKENADLKGRLNKLISIHDAIPAGVCLFQQGQLVEINQTALAMLACRPEEIVGHEFTDLIHPDHRTAMKEKLKDWIAQNPIPDMFETCLVTKNNDSLYCDLRANKIRLNGRTTFVLFITDSEDRKKWEKEIISSRKNIALITLSSGIAGRLSQYLEPLLSGLDTLRELPEPRHVRFKESFGCIEDASHSIQEITRQLNRLNTRPHPPEKLSPLAINDQIQAAISIVKSRLALSSSPNPGGIIIKTFYRSKSVVMLSHEEIQEAFVHLIMNSCEAITENGDILITTEEYDGFAHIYLQDNGLGIPEAIMDRIFDPFYTSRVRHSGLGLSIAYSIIKRHNGFIDVTSRRGQGTTFQIRLPLSETVSLSLSGMKKNKKLGENRLLVIHKDSLIRELISQLFSDKGCRVINAETGIEGSNHINKMRFDFLITDTHALGLKPGLLIEQYKKRNNDSPAALIWPERAAGEKDQLTNPGVDLIIRQPIDIDRMVKDISHLLKYGKYNRK